MTAGTKRIKVGRGHRYELDGQKVDGVTTVLSNGVPKPALIGWAAGVIAEYVGERLDIDPDSGDVGAGRLVEALRIVGKGNRYNRWPKDGTVSRLALVETLKGLHWQERDEAGHRGTEVHGLCERIIHGDEVDVPDVLLGHVDAYMRFLADFDVRPVLVEFVCGNRTHGWMGTGDLIADLCDGLRWLLDIKTARSGIYPDNTLQLAAYRNAEFYIDADGNEQPMPPVDRVGAIWVRADGYDLTPLDAGPAAYKVFRHAQQVARWQTVTGAETVGDVIPPPLRMLEETSA